MKQTRQLQFAAELIEEVSNNVTDSEVADELQRLSERVDEKRKDVFQERLKERVEKKGAASQHID